MGRQGFTLLEMILVLMLMTIILGLSMPMVDSMMHPNQVAASVDAVRAQWAEGRSRAMEDGRPYKFSVEEPTGNFRLESDDLDDPTAEQGLQREWFIPQPCRFVESLDSLKGAAEAITPSGNWRTVAVFLPDGTARQDAVLNFGRP